MHATEILAALGIIPDSSGRFNMSWPITHPAGGHLMTKFRFTEGQLFDNYNRRWTTEEFWEALRRAGQLPSSPAADGIHCRHCGADLTGSHTRFCSAACRTLWKREAMRERRGFKPHVHICRDCGRQFHVGRPPKAAQTL
jgi:hypothetical protein